MEDTHTTRYKIHNYSNGEAKWYIKKIGNRGTDYINNTGLVVSAGVILDGTGWMKTREEAEEIIRRIQFKTAVHIGGE